MAGGDLKMADWTCSSPVACADIILSCVMLGEGILIGSGLLDGPALLGLVHVPPDTGNRKRLLTGQCYRAGFGLLVLVPILVPFSSSGAPDDGRQEPEEAADMGDVPEEVVDVVGVVFIDIGLINHLYPLPDEQIHPRISTSWNDLVSRSDSLRWDHSRGGGPHHFALSCQKNYLGEKCLHASCQLHHELLNSCCRHHLP